MIPNSKKPGFWTTKFNQVSGMIISHIILRNWRNFRSVEVNLRDRVFVVGPNACGKSNFLDAFRFLRDLAKSGGGLQKAVSDRGGVSNIGSTIAILTSSILPKAEDPQAIGSPVLMVISKNY